MKVGVVEKGLMRVFVEREPSGWFTFLADGPQSLSLAVQLASRQAESMRSGYTPESFEGWSNLLVGRKVA